MQRKKWISMVFIACCVFSLSYAQSEELVIPEIVGDNDKLIGDILSLILSKTDPDVKLRQLPEDVPLSRLSEEVSSGKVSIIWGAADPRLEADLLTVRIPVLKGLLGHRIFIIKKGNQSRFDNITTLAQLKQLKAGQGLFWGDTQVLKNAHVPLVTTLKYPNLFLMLEGDRFDYFPRAIHEPWTEVASRPELNLVVEKNIMLVYPFAMYFYVKKGNQALHDKLYQGFEIALADGSLNELFFNNPMIKDALQKTNLKHRTVIRIENPNMHVDTSTDRAKFWLDPTSL